MNQTNNSSYIFYLAKSAEAARLIGRGLREATPWTRSGGCAISTGSGCVHQDCRIPEIYHSSDRWYAYIEYRNGEDLNHPEYKIVIC